MNVCELCGKTIRPKSKLCVSCYRGAGNPRRLAKKVCIACRQEYQPKYRQQKCCSDNCAKAKADQTKREQAGQLSDIVKVCARCNKKYRQRLYKTQQIYCEDCIAFKDRDKCRRRRAKINAVAAQKINEFEVFERDRWSCQLCGLPIDKAAQWPESDSASLDHIVPLSKGGTHTMDNVQSAHLGCNCRKNNREEFYVTQRAVAQTNTPKSVRGQSRQAGIK